MFDVVLDSDVLERLAIRLEQWASQLSHEESAHLVGLVGLGSTALTQAIGGVPPQTYQTSATEIELMESPGFADALSPAADMVLQGAATGHSVVITAGPEPHRWAVTAPVRQPEKQSLRSGLARN